MSFVQIARSANVPVLLDAGGVGTPIPREFLKCVTILSVNEAELARPTGMPTCELYQITVAAISVHQLVCSRLIVGSKQIFLLLKISFILLCSERSGALEDPFMKFHISLALLVTTYGKVYVVIKHVVLIERW